MDGGDRIIAEQVVGAADDRDVMRDVSGHVVALECLHVTSAHHAGGKGSRGVKEQLVDKSALAAEDDGHERACVVVQLGQCVQLGEDIQAQQVGLVDEQDGDLFLGGDVCEKSANDGKYLGHGVGGRSIAEGKANLTQQLQEASGGSHQRDQTILRGMKRGGSGAQGGALARADLAGDDGGQAVSHRVVETLAEGIQAGQGVEMLQRDVLREGLTGEAEQDDE